MDDVDIRLQNNVDGCFSRLAQRFPRFGELDWGELTREQLMDYGQLLIDYGRALQLQNELASR